MITLKNNSTKVIVFKAWGLKTIRVIPGFNNIDISEEKWEKYIKSDVAKATLEEHITVIKRELNEEEFEQAEEAKKKNEILNKKKGVSPIEKKLIKEEKEKIKKKTTKKKETK